MATTDTAHSLRPSPLTNGGAVIINNPQFSKKPQGDSTHLERWKIGAARLFFLMGLALLAKRTQQLAW